MDIVVTYTVGMYVLEMSLIVICTACNPESMRIIIECCTPQFERKPKYVFIRENCVSAMDSVLRWYRLLKKPRGELRSIREDWEMVELVAVA